MDRKIYYHLDRVDALIAGRPEMPVTVEVDPSNRCQLECSYCMYKTLRSKDSGAVDLPFETFRYLLLDLKSVAVRSITFTGGGEPTLNPFFNEMVDLADEMGFEYGLITNGLRLHKVRRLERFRFIRVSLDAANFETYQILKQSPGFHKVIENIQDGIRRGGLIGLSFVVNGLNKNDIPQAQQLADELRVAYIQFKPAWIDGKPYQDYHVPEQTRSILTDRYRAVDRIPCAIAGLVGIVGADSHVYYCCQYRGDSRYDLGSLQQASFLDVWKRRPHLVPDIRECPHCRYMNYTRAYKELLGGGSLFFQHRHFL